MNLKIIFDYDDRFGLPEVEIGVDQTCLHNGTVQNYFEFDIDLNDGPHELYIVHKNKTMDQTTADHDKHVFIKSLEFDQVNLDQLHYNPLTHRGRFYPKYEESYQADQLKNAIDLPEFISPNHYLGHNGIWRLAFNTPAMVWVIQEQNPSGIVLENTIASTSDDVLADIKNFFDL